MVLLTTGPWPLLLILLLLLLLPDKVQELPTGAWFRWITARQRLAVSYDEKVCCHDSCTPLAVVGRSGPVDGRPLLLLFALVLKGALPGFLSAHGPHPELD